MKVLSTLDLQQNRVINVGAAVGGSDLVTKDQLTAAMEGIKQKAAAKTVATTNITLSGEQTIGSTPVVAGDRVLVIGQTNAADNGIYDVSATAWTRSADANIWDELVGAGIWINDARAFYRADIAAGGTLGTTAISFILVIQHSELPSNIAKKHIETISCDGISTEYTINHGLDSFHITVSVLDPSGMPGEGGQVLVNWQGINSNSLKIIFSTPPSNEQEYNVIVIG